MRHDAWYRNWVIAAVALMSFGVIIMLSACAPPPPPPPPPAAVVVGDSIGYMMAVNQTWKLGMPVEADAYPGRRLDNPSCVAMVEPAMPAEHFIASTLGYGAEDFPPQPLGLDVLRVKVASTPARDPVVVELGTNDISDGRSCIPATWPSSVAKASAAVPAGRQMVWVLPYRRGMGSREFAFGAAVVKTLDARVRATVVDWPAVAATHPEFLLPDGTHLTAAGESAYAALVRKALTCNCKVVSS